MSCQGKCVHVDCPSGVLSTLFRLGQALWHTQPSCWCEVVVFEGRRQLLEGGQGVGKDGCVWVHHPNVYCLDCNFGQG